MHYWFTRSVRALLVHSQWTCTVGAHLVHFHCWFNPSELALLIHSFVIIAIFFKINISLWKMCRTKVCRTKVCRTKVCRTKVCRTKVCRTKVCRTKMCRTHTVSRLAALQRYLRRPASPTVSFVARYRPTAGAYFPIKGCWISVSTDRFWSCSDRVVDEHVESEAGTVHLSCYRWQRGVGWRSP